jgi:hypothetical protein
MYQSKGQIKEYIGQAERRCQKAGNREQSVEGREKNAKRNSRAQITEGRKQSAKRRSESTEGSKEKAESRG